MRAARSTVEAAYLARIAAASAKTLSRRCLGAIREYRVSHRHHCDGRSRRAAKSSASDIASISFIGPHPACWFSVGFKARSLSKAVREADEDLTNIRPANCARICARMVTFLPTQCERNQSTISRDLPWKTLTI